MREIERDERHMFYLGTVPTYIVQALLLALAVGSGGQSLFYSCITDVGVSR